MKIFFRIIIKLFTITLCIANVAYARNLNYTFDVKHDHIKVTLDMEGNISNSSKFYLPIMFVMEGEYKPLNIKIDSVKTNYNVNLNDFSISFNHRPYAKMQISYELHNFKKYYSNLYFTINPKYFFFFSNYCLMLPDIPEQELNNINFDFSLYPIKIFSNLNHKNNKIREIL